MRTSTTALLLTLSPVALTPLIASSQEPSKIVFMFPGSSA
jgi:hypothetical protein